MPDTNPLRSDPAVAAHIDTTKAGVARVDDAFLNGQDNYEVDREVLRQVQQVVPEAVQVAWDNRDFLIRVTRFIARQTGIAQFLDCGSGLPTAENTHQVVQRIQPDAQVVYIDNDPSVIAHGQALLQRNYCAHFVAADIFEPRQVIDDERVRSYLDFSQPIALFHFATLHHYAGERSPASIMQEYIDALAAGSYVAISPTVHGSSR